MTMQCSPPAKAAAIATHTEAMTVSTRGRYALRVMIDLAEHYDGGFTPMRDVAQRQKISLKYLERIVPPLAKAGLLTATHGCTGGYRLARAPQECCVGEILRLTEGDFTTVSCVGPGAVDCELSENCRTRSLWYNLDKVVNDYLDGVFLSDLITPARETPE